MNINDYIGKIINGDCLEVLQKMPDKCVDLVVTSPPYNVGIKYNDLMSDSKANEDYMRFTRGYLSECYRILKDDGRFCLNIGYKVSTVKDAGIDYIDLLNLIKSIGYTIRETIIWVKTHKAKTPQSFCGSTTAWGSWLSASNPICRARMEFVFVLNKKLSSKNTRGISTITKQEFLEYTTSVWYFPTETNRIHKAPFPIELPYRCIQLYTYKDDNVLDPFIGSGTTAVASVITNRHYIGIEISPEYCDIARKRIITEQNKMF